MRTGVGSLGGLRRAYGQRLGGLGWYGSARPGLRLVLAATAEAAVGLGRQPLAWRARPVANWGLVRLAVGLGAVVVGVRAVRGLGVGAVSQPAAVLGQAGVLAPASPTHAHLVRAAYAAPLRGLGGVSQPQLAPAVTCVLVPGPGVWPVAGPLLAVRQPGWAPQWAPLSPLVAAVYGGAQVRRGVWALACAAARVSRAEPQSGAWAWGWLAPRLAATAASATPTTVAAVAGSASVRLAAGGLLQPAPRRGWRLA